MVLGSCWLEKTKRRPEKEPGRHQQHIVFAVSARKYSDRLEILKSGSFIRIWAFGVLEAGSIGVRYQHSAAHISQKASEVRSAAPTFLSSE